MPGDDTSAATGRTSRPVEVRVWDPVVRLFHWSLIASLTVAWLTRGTWDAAHELAGYAIAGLLAGRLLWGFIGTRHARFSDFVTTPRATLRYLRDMARGSAPRELGHNPPGAAMILALLGLLVLVVISGHMMTTNAFFGVSWVEDTHSLAVYVLLGLAGLHVAGVIFSSIEHRENLVAAMFSGRKRSLDSQPGRFRVFGLLASIVAVLASLGVLGGIVNLLSLDLARFEREIVRAANRATGDKLIIGEPLEVSLFPTPSITARNLKLLGTATEEGVAIETVVAEIDPLAAVNGTFTVTRLTVNGIDVTIRNEPSIEPDQLAAGAAPHEAGLGWLRVFPKARQVRLNDVSIHVADGDQPALGKHNLAIKLDIAEDQSLADVQVSAMLDDTPVWLQGTTRRGAAIDGRPVYQFSLAGSSNKGDVAIEGGIIGSSYGGPPGVAVKVAGDASVIAALGRLAPKPTIVAANAAANRARVPETPPVATTTGPTKQPATELETPEATTTVPPRPDGSAGSAPGAIATARKSGAPRSDPAASGSPGDASPSIASDTIANVTPANVRNANRSATTRDQGRPRFAADESAPRDTNAEATQARRARATSQRVAKAKATSPRASRTARLAAQRSASAANRATTSSTRSAAQTKKAPATTPRASKARQAVAKLATPGTTIRAAFPRGARLAKRKRQADDAKINASSRKAKKAASRGDKGRKGRGRGRSGKGSGSSGSSKSGSGKSGSGKSGSGSSGSGKSGSGNSGKGGSSGSGGGGSGGGGSGSGGSGGGSGHN